MDETSSTLADKSALTVSALSNALRRTLEERFGIVRVRGEISGFRGPHASGHLYFALKDDGARLDAVIWKSTFQKMRVKPAEGLEVVASGKLTTFPGKSSYQIVIDSVEPAGVGALMTMLEARRRQLASEGLFDIACKQPLPFLPTVVGVVTSPSGSVIRDILHRLADRFPIHVIIWPVRVQGDNSAEEIANAIAGFNALSEDGSVPRPDVLIVARGGGSLEDLWSFNEENVVRAAHESKIPLVSAIGHETDWTLIDHAADYRAPTPTAAAEICVPVRSQLVARVGVAKGRLVEACRRLGQRNKTELRAISRGLPSASDVASGPRQRLDSLGDGLNSRMRFCFSANELAISATIRRHANCSPRVQLSRASERISIAAIQLVGFANSLRVHGRVIMDRVESELLHCSTSTTRRRRDLLGTNTNRWIICSNLTRRYTAELVKTFALLSTRLSFGISGLVDRERSEFENVEQLFRAVNHMAVLARGYAFIRDKFGVPISSAGAAANVKQLRIQFIDAEIVAKIINKQAAKIGDAKFKDIEQDVLFELS